MRQVAIKNRRFIRADDFRCEHKQLQALIQGRKQFGPLPQPTAQGLHQSPSERDTINGVGMQSIEEAVIAKLRELPADRQKEVLDFASSLTTGEQSRPKLKNVRGLWKDLGISISEEDIAEARKEMWGNFPREQFFK